MGSVHAACLPLGTACVDAASQCLGAWVLVLLNNVLCTTTAGIVHWALPVWCLTGGTGMTPSVQWLWHAATSTSGCGRGC